MKKIFISFVILISSFNVKQVQAQWVLIPDSNFRNAIAVLVPVAISGNYMDTTNSQITTMTSLIVEYKNINDLTGVQYFDHLLTLKCYGNNLSSLPALPSMLTYLDCGLNQISTLPLLPSSLTTLSCRNNDLTLLPALPSQLTFLNCISNQLNSLPVLPSSLSTLYCGQNALTSLPALPSSLTFLNCEFNQLTALPVLPSGLTYLECRYNMLSSLPSLPSPLYALDCGSNQLTSLPALPLSLLYLQCYDNHLASLPSLPSQLDRLLCCCNQLTSFPPLPSSLTYLDCSFNQIACLSAIPASLEKLYGLNAGYSCLPNIPSSLTTITGPTSICSQNQAIITPAGPTTFCSGGSVSLNANTGTGLSYQWKKNGASISGATASSYIATTTGSYTVVEAGSTGCIGEPSAAVVVSVKTLPSAAISPAGATTFCSGGSVTLNAVVAANRTYQWKKGANLVSGATLSSYTANTGGNYRVIVTNTVTGCSKTTGSATIVTVNALPAAAITPQGPTTFCAGGSVVLAANTGTGLTYKWKKGSNFISGATLSNYTATTGGNYRVQVTNGNGCSKTSGNVAVSVPCKEGQNLFSQNNFDVRVFPNPSSGDFVFEIENTEEEKISIYIYDMIGKLVLSESTINSQFTIHNSQLVSGIYSAVILMGENKKMLKLIKTQ